MPLTEHVHYLVRFKLADGEHIASSQSIKATTEKQKAFVRREILRSLNPTSVEYPEGNPAFQLVEIREATIDETIEAANALRATPGRVGADQLGLDTPNRILHDPSITDAIAADKAVG